MLASQLAYWAMPSLAELSALGVNRISVGSALSRAALIAFLRAAHQLRDRGNRSTIVLHYNYDQGSHVTTGWRLSECHLAERHG